MQIINQIGHLQHWGLTPATNFLSHYPQPAPKNPIKVLLTGTSDIRHILKTLTDIDIAKNTHPPKIEIYFHQTHKELLCRALLFLHILHQVGLNFQERVELFLDLYGNALIKQRNSRYVSNLRLDLLNLIHNEKKIQTPIKSFTKLNLLKFEQRDQMSQIIQSWSNKIQYDIVKLRDQRLRYMFKQRYDYRNNLVDWDYNMLLSQYAPIMHFYHYKEWRLTGLAFEQRFSTYTEPNRTLASYVPGKKKQQRTSCLVRGYWGDMIISPYIAMGVETNSKQKQPLFKKANQKYIGHSVQLTQYNLTYWLQRLETQTTYEKYFRDYYRTDQVGKKKLQQKQKIKKSKKEKLEKVGKELGEVKQQQEKEDQKQQQETIAEKQQKQKQQQKTNKETQKTQQTQKSQQKIQKQQQQEITQKQEKSQKLPSQQKQQQQQLDSQQQQRKQATQKKNAQDIKPIYESQSSQTKKLKLFQKYGIQFYPLSMPIQNLTKPKYKQFFDVIVCGFVHSAYLGKDRYLQNTLKKDGLLYVQSARYVVPKRKQERKELYEKLKVIVAEKPSKEGEKESVLQILDEGVDYIIYKKIE